MREELLAERAEMVGRNWCVFGCPCGKKNNTRTRRCGRGESFICAMVARLEIKFASKEIAENKCVGRVVLMGQVVKNETFEASP